MNSKNNLRTQKTLQTIKNTFVNMLLEMDFEKINVKTLCERAEINRRTFYLHFDSIDDLLVSIQEDFSNEFYERIKNYDHILNVEELVKEYFIFSEEKGKIAEKLNCNMNFDYIRQQLTDMVTIKVHDKNFRSIDKYDYFSKNIILNYMNAATIGIYRQWVKDKRNLPLEKVVELSSKLIKSGVNSLL